MSLLVQHDTTAHALLIGGVVVAAGSEVVATYLGQARDGQRRFGGSMSEALLMRKRSGGSAADRWTKQVLVGTILAGLLVASLLASREPGVRAYANNWTTLVLGLGLVAAGVAIRSWAVWTLGRFFRREVTIEAGQRVVSSGPYRFVRHPAYAGNILMYAGFGLAIGSWLSAGLLLAFAIAAHIPRIRVEEAELEREFGDDYRDYERKTSRLVPGIW
jgi:protein-S-isoprenylcysteine O-methyltransferase Ste14